MALTFLSRSPCPLCGLPLPPATACAPCLHELGSANRGGEFPAPFDFSGRLAASIRRAKYRGDRPTALGLGRLFADRVWDAGLSDSVDAITFVPAHWRRRVERGLYLPELLAAEVSRRSELPLAELLRNARHLPPLAGMSARQRSEAVRGRYRVRWRWRRPLRALLIDDVVTTGATLREAKRVLEASGIKVQGVALARTPPS